jgi:hypothetical protein
MWIWFLVGLAAAASLGAVAWGFRRPEADDPEWQAAYDKMIANDAEPYKAWASAAFRVVVLNFDPAYRPHWSRRAVAAAWEFDSVEGMEAVLAPLEAGVEAWDLLRGVLVLRMSVGMGLITDAASWARVRVLCLRLQGAYSGWEPMVEDYLAGRRADLGLAEDGHMDDERFGEIAEAVQTLRDEVWGGVEYLGAI